MSFGVAGTTSHTFRWTFLPTWSRFLPQNKQCFILSSLNGVHFGVLYCFCVVFACFYNVTVGCCSPRCLLCCFVKYCTALIDSFESCVKRFCCEAASSNSAAPRTSASVWLLPRHCRMIYFCQWFWLISKTNWSRKGSSRLLPKHANHFNSVRNTCMLSYSFCCLFGKFSSIASINTLHL